MAGDATVVAPAGWRRLALAAAAAAVGAVVVVLRRPDAVVRPQFWAEDALVWYTHAYERGGLQVLLQPYAGYLELLPRLIAAGAVRVPFADAPAFMNAWGIFFQVLPVLFLLSGRLDEAIPSRRLQAALAAAYLLLPYSYEINVTITNVQWHLALLCLLVLLASPAQGGLWWAFDLAVGVVTGLTGPLVVLLAVAILLRLAFVSRDRWTISLACVMVAAAGLELAVAQLNPGQRPAPPVGLRADTFAHVLGGPLLVAQTLGTAVYTALWHSSHWHSVSRFPYFLAAITVAISAWAAWLGPWQLRLALLVAWVELVAIFLAPQSKPESGFLFSVPPLAGRYYFLFYCAWYAALASLLVRARRSWRVIPGVLAGASLVIAMPMDFEYPAVPDYHFGRAVRALADAPPGAPVTFQVPPGFYLTLHKRSG